MKKHAPFFLLTGLLVGFAILMAGFDGDSPMNGSGAPAKNTNSPGDGQNCTHCMGGTATAVTDWITSDVPADGYIPGNTYTITATGTGTGNKGFEISPQDLAGNLIGTLTAGTGNKLVGSLKYVTHSAAVSANPAVWTFQWTAPSTGVGDVTFYGSFAITKFATKTTTLVVHESTVGIGPAEHAEWKFFPNPAHGRISVEVSPGETGPVKIEMLSLNGRLIGEMPAGNPAVGAITCEIPAGQPAGLYLLRVTTGKGQSAKKIIVD